MRLKHNAFLTLCITPLCLPHPPYILLKKEPYVFVMWVCTNTMAPIILLSHLYLIIRMETCVYTRADMTTHF